MRAKRLFLLFVSSTLLLSACFSLLYEEFVVEGQVWLDTDSNNFLDENDPSATGTLVTLYGVTVEGEYRVLDSAFIGNSRSYRFEVAGDYPSYVVLFTPRSETQLFLLNTATDDNPQAAGQSAFSHVWEIDPATGEASSMEFSAGDRTVNAGLVDSTAQLPTPTFAATDVPEPTPTTVPISGTYSCRFEVVLDRAGHGIHIQLEDEMDLDVHIQAGNLLIDGQAPFVPVNGPIQSNGFFQAMGNGEVAGFSDIEVDMEGTLTDSGLEAEYGMGVGGGLPQGEPIYYAMLCNLLASRDGAGAPSPIYETAQEALDVGIARYEAGDVDGALSAFYQALTIDPQFKDAHYNIGVIFFEREEYEGAISAFENALAIDDRYEIAWYGLARSLDALEMWEEAYSSWQRFLEVHTKEDDFRAYASQRLEALGEAGYGE